ncbi:MAG: quinohemoprotein amine dehydrogenase subunit alpha [Acidobacteria bacterium RIFCSPLOWO2_12_FULL_67_14b]|nr:MAG: quinohemoprotein amine dehydrogenase subunit alpha [Acidobacteria bacterium RIFCSPLOWO2_12_FULL_67_14b]
MTPTASVDSRPNVRTATRALAGTTLVLVALLARAVSTEQPAAPTAKPDEGIPITDQTVQKACGSCHRADEKGQLSRISFQRHTPEGWQSTIQRMAGLNGLQIDPATARQVVKYLSNHLGLAPEEAKPASWEVERRGTDFKYTASTDTEAVCIKCHSMGRVISQRRTKAEWDLLIAMHRGWYPLVDNQAFRRNGPPPRDPSPDGRPPDTRHPVEKAVDHLARTFPLKTPEWTAWSATMRPARLEGTWALSGWDLGKGAIYGSVGIAAVSGSTDEFTTTITYRVARTGETISRTGRSIVYTGYQWRGRSVAGGSQDTALREVMFVDRDWRQIEGRWFSGGYDEIGLDIRLDRVGAEPRLLGTDRTALRAGSTAQELKIYGANLPASLRPADVDLGPGLTVSRIASVAPDLATVVVDVAGNAAVGVRDLFVAGASKPKALAVFDRIDSIKVKPDWAMARVGGGTFPKMLAQFEAWAFHNGVDGRPDTADDINLGLVDAAWSMEEYAATYGDDDIKFVGTLNEATGRFTPNVDGPNPQRRGERNNIGDVWVVAKYTVDGTGGKPAPTIRARAHLLVTVPLYMRFDPTVGGQ